MSDHPQLVVKTADTKEVLQPFSVRRFALEIRPCGLGARSDARKRSSVQGPNIGETLGNGRNPAERADLMGLCIYMWWTVRADELPYGANPSPLLVFWFVRLWREAYLTLRGR